MKRGRMRRRPPGTTLPLLYCLLLFPQASACLSNPGMRCSVAGSSSNCMTLVHAAATRALTGSVYDTGQYTGFLGNQVEAKAYSAPANISQFAVNDIELQCFNFTQCSWRNDEDDQLDWVTGAGNVDFEKINLITGSMVMPGPNFILLASDSRPQFFAGSWVSKPIACQPSTGLLAFRMWKSRARVEGQEPDLDVCTRRVLETTLENCLTIESTENNTILASIPPMREPFEIVIRGYGFENEPEGGLIIVDMIDYFAELQSADDCASSDDPHEGAVVPVTRGPPITTPVTEVPSDPKFTKYTMLPTYPTLVMNEHRIREQKSAFREGNDEIIFTSGETTNGCRSLECSLDESSDEGCMYRRVGTGAKGDGYRVGWRVARYAITPSNILTGIHEPARESEPSFLFAEFPGFSLDRKEHRYVLESPEFLMEEDANAYLSFFKYIATKGIELKICEDYTGESCFWTADRDSNEPFGRRWTRDVVKIPSTINKFFVLCTQLESERASVGYIGLSSIGLYSDALAAHPFC